MSEDFAPESAGAALGGAREKELRGDIQGLRAVAVSLVLAFHAGLPGMRGGYVGVDVFFVISGFLITGLIVREIERHGRLDLRRFYARRARRLLPAIALTLLFVAAITVAWLPNTRFESIAMDCVASATYVMNFRLARASVDYLQAEDTPSPLQHFWSLAVEEQFYVIWPLLILGLLFVHRRAGWPLRRTLLAGIALIGLPSLYWSVRLTGQSPQEAFFVSTTRAWELSIGAALAIGAPMLARMPAKAARWLAWAGLAAIIIAGVSYRTTTAFPGYAAILPTLGTAAVIAAGTADPRTLAAKALGVGPLQGVGTMSYALYLFHWPLVIAAATLWAKDGQPLAVSVGVAAVLASVPVAWLAHRFVEMPLHHAEVFVRRVGTALALGLGCTALGALAAFAVHAAVPRDHALVDPKQIVGAGVLGLTPGERADSWVTNTSADIQPSPRKAAHDTPRLGGVECSRDDRCTYGPENGTLNIAIVGDSKMEQWLSALQPLADKNHWKLKTFLRSACALLHGPAVDGNGAIVKSCVKTNDRRLAELKKDASIDIVLTSQRARIAYAKDGADGGAAMVRDLRTLWAELEAAGREVVVVLDNPAPPFDVMECVSKHPQELSACAFPRAEGLGRSASTVQREALKQAPGIDVIDMDRYFCPGERCPAVIGNVLVYRRGSHVTSTYISTLAPQFGAALDKVIRKLRAENGLPRLTAR
jgi:peptidoglycan/LPS O-acetylase OafA/YrhL